MLGNLSSRRLRSLRARPRPGAGAQGPALSTSAAGLPPPRRARRCVYLYLYGIMCAVTTVRTDSSTV